MTTHIQQWDPISKFFHWSTLLLILVMITLGWVAVNYPMSPTKIKLFIWHKSLGLFVLFWIVLRLMWRLSHTGPNLPSSMSRTQRYLARLSHVALYVVLISMPISGWVINSTADFPLRWFGLFQVPPIAPASEVLQQAAESIHFYLFCLLTALLLLHIAAAFYHHWFKRDDVLLRMLPLIKTHDH